MRSQKEMIAVFAGTTEGRQLCEYLVKQQRDIVGFVATEYGRALLDEETKKRVRVGRLTETEMEQVLKTESPSLVVDATHPYAMEVTQNIQTACTKLNLPYLRLKRKETKLEQDETTILVKSAKEAADWLLKKKGNVLLTIGSKEMEAFQILPDFTQRIYARILPMASMIAKWEQKGLTGRHLIGMQGPFSEQMNRTMIEEFQIQYLVTKESGATGGFIQKREAAKKTGCKLVVIERPQKEEGISLEELMKQLGGEDEENCNCWSWNGKLEDADCGSEGTNPAGTAFDWSKTSDRTVFSCIDCN